MLEAFIRLHDLDVILLQEVSQHFTDIPGYTPHCNIRTTRRSTALILRDLLTLTHITPLPSGPAIAANFGDLSVINIYVTSDTAKRYERKAFFNKDLAYQLRTVRQPLNRRRLQLHPCQI